MKIPLEKRLRKRAHRLIAALQDEVLEILYSLQQKLIIHGGTAIWRCYGGGRFSEDIDMYSASLPEGFENQLREMVHSRGLQLKKFKKTGNLVFCKVADGEVEIRIEINFSKAPHAIAIPYEKLDGSSMIVFALPIDALIIEKAAAYLSRKFVRDIYDVYFLAGRGALDGKTEKQLGGMLANLPEPIDESNLNSIVYSGAVPSFGQMREYLEGRFK